MSTSSPGPAASRERSPRLRSIRLRLLLSLLVGSGLLLLATDLLVEVGLRSWLVHEFDRTLEAKARALVALTEIDEGAPAFELVEGLMPEFEAGERPEYFQLWLADGSPFVRSSSLAAGDLEATPRTCAEPCFEDVSLPDGRRGRLVRLDFIPHVDQGERGEPLDGAARPDPPTMALGVARSRGRLDQLERTLHLVLVGGSALLMLGVIACVHLAIGAGLRPMTVITEQVAKLDASSLGSRLDFEDAPAEITALIGKLNDLLARLDAAFERERRFSSDVAQELRMPVAELRGLAEVAARRPDVHQARTAYFQDVFEISLGMEQTITDLLALAPSERGLEPVHTEVFSLIESP